MKESTPSYPLQPISVPLSHTVVDLQFTFLLFASRHCENPTVLPDTVLVEGQGLGKLMPGRQTTNNIITDDDQCFGKPGVTKNNMRFQFHVGCS